MIVAGFLGSWITHGYGLPAAAWAFAMVYVVSMTWNAVRSIRFSPTPARSV
jgi:hypothetical protein